jgi:dTMP kinase
VVITTGEFFASLLNAGRSGHGILVAVVGTGLVLGLVAAAPLAARLEPERLFAPGIGIAGLGLAVTATMPTLAAVIAPALAMGLGAGITFIVGYTVLQQRSDDHIRGRTFGAFNSGVRLAIFASIVAVPAIIGVIGIEARTILTLDDGRTVYQYPYAFGGIRVTLLGAGLLAIAGAVITGRALHLALDREIAREQGSSALVLTPDVELSPTLRGVMIAFEGGDGTGKSTQIRMLRSAIEGEGHDVLVTREPGGTAIGERIRDVVLSLDHEAMDDRAEALLYAAARAQHVEEVIRPALAKGSVVLCDRFVDSSLVYQGAARGLGEEEVAELNRWATGGLRPDLVVLLDLDPTAGLERAAGSGPADRLEAAGLDFHVLVRDAYRRLAEAEPDRFLVLDARRAPAEVHREIRVRVLRALTEREELT